jgi:hypothetical protein
LYNFVHRVYAEVSNGLKTVILESAAKEEALTKAVKDAEANEGFREQKRRK